MSRLRMAMIADLELRRYSPRTVKQYVWCAKHFFDHYMRPAAELGEPEVRGFLLHLVHVKKVKPAVHKMHVAAIRFVYTHTLRRSEVVHWLP